MSTLNHAGHGQVYAVEVVPRQSLERAYSGESSLVPVCNVTVKGTEGTTITFIWTPTSDEDTPPAVGSFVAFAVEHVEVTPS